MTPVNTKLFAHIIEEALENINLGYSYTSPRTGRLYDEDPIVKGKLKGFSDKLLRHNTSKHRENQWDLFKGLDFDITHIASKEDGCKTFINPYFNNPEYRRDDSEVRVVFHLRYNEIQGTEWTISFPIQMVMKGFPKMKEGHIGYAHSVALKAPDTGLCLEQHYYAGITKRNWLKRMSEHFREIQSGSNKTFHKAWRDYVGRNDVMLCSELITMNHTYQQIMDWEEWAVDTQMEKGTSLNMIPGGFKGIRFLHQHRLLNSDNPSLIEREKALVEYQRINPRAGVPNLIISELWKNDEYAAKIICGAEGRLSIAQVREIRHLHELDLPIVKIKERVKALNDEQVKNVLTGKTYSRIS
jgi:hypothetical protein